MFNRLTILAGATLAFVGAGCGMMSDEAVQPSVQVASGTKEDTDRVEHVQTVKVTAVVEDIDVAKRLVTLRGPDGNVRVVAVDESVRNLAQVRKGDTVAVEYFESLAIQLVKPGTAKVGDIAAAEGLERAEPGQKPGGVGARAITVVTEVEAIDKKAGTVTLKGAGGKSETIKAQNPANLDKIKVGDTLEVTYTEAVAISVEKP